MTVVVILHQQHHKKHIKTNQSWSHFFVIHKCDHELEGTLRNVIHSKNGFLHFQGIKQSGFYLRSLITCFMSHPQKII